MLLYLSLSPSFFLTHPLASTSTSFFPSTSANHALDIARQSPAFRRAVVSALQALLEQSFGGSGLEEKAVEVWRRAANDSDDHVRLVALRGLAHFGSVIHPIVPPQQPNSAYTRIRHEQKGGFVGDEEDFAETAEVFRLRVVPEREAIDDEDERMETEERVAAAAAAEEDERKRKLTAAPAAAPSFASSAPTSFSASSFAPPPAAAAVAASGASSFAALATPAFGSSALSTSPAGADKLGGSAPQATGSFAPVDVVAPSSFIESSTTARAASNTAHDSAAGGQSASEATTALRGEAGDDDDSDDDEMPAIDLGGSDEE